MTIEQVKAEAKKRFDKDLTDEQAKTLLDSYIAGELSEGDLENVAGGCSKKEFDRAFSMAGESIGIALGITNPPPPVTAEPVGQVIKKGSLLSDSSLKAVTAGRIEDPRSLPSGRPVVCPACGYSFTPAGGLLHGNTYLCKKCGQWFIADITGHHKCIDKP